MDSHSLSLYGPLDGTTKRRRTSIPLGILVRDENFWDMRSCSRRRTVNVIHLPESQRGSNHFRGPNRVTWSSCQTRREASMMEDNEFIIDNCFASKLITGLSRPWIMVTIELSGDT